MAAEHVAELVERVVGALQGLDLGDGDAVGRSAEKVIQPANMCPCGVMSVNDSSSAYSTSTPVDSFTPPGMPRLSRATSPGAMPASGP